jgi:ubiquinone/menaquinone biosynthesis C-methylase UbiE
MIDQARQRAGELTNVELVIGDSEKLPFADSEFTTVLCTTSLHHYPHPERAITEMARVLTPGGRLAIGDANRAGLFMRPVDAFYRRFQAGHARMLTPYEVAHHMNQAGLVTTGSRRLWHGRYYIVIARKKDATNTGSESQTADARTE